MRIKKLKATKTNFAVGNYYLLMPGFLAIYCWSSSDLYLYPYKSNQAEQFLKEYKNYKVVSSPNSDYFALIDNVDNDTNTVSCYNKERVQIGLKVDVVKPTYVKFTSNT